MNCPTLVSCCFLALLPSGALLGASVPPSIPPGRLVKTINGIRIEYSPGEEAYLKPTAKRLAAWDRRFHQPKSSEQASRQKPLPLSARDMLDNRAAILRQIAATVGLKRPPPLEAYCYDTMLDYYRWLALLSHNVGNLGLRVVYPSQITIWNRKELVRRLTTGERIPGFSYDPKTGKVDFAFTPKMDLKGPASPEAQRRIRQQVDREMLDHSFNYTTDSHRIAHISATFRLNVEKPEDSAGTSAVDREIRVAMHQLGQLFAKTKLPAWPVVLSRKNAGDSPAKIADNLVNELRDIGNELHRLKEYRNPNLAMVVLHEATEAAIVEHYIGSPHRRWLCDGTANYVAWKIARDRAGPQFARAVYNLKAQLARYAKYQKEINLRAWPAVERQPEADRNTPLNKADYAFATRAIFLLVRESGNDALPRLFREIGRTPREKVSMKTVAKAYRKLTGHRLDTLLEAAEYDPIPPLDSGTGLPSGARRRSS